MKKNPKLAESSTEKSQTPDEDFPIVGIGASAGGLRKRAEDALQGKTEEQQELSIRDARSLIHELQLHQIELEMQNEELRRAQKELEESHDRYSDLYDFAPVGYFSFDKNGLIIEVNLTGAKKLGVERNFLIKKPFSLFISPGSKDVFYLHLRQVFRTGVRQTCNLRLVDKKGVQLDIQLESLSVQEGNSVHCRTAMSNITESKLAEEVSQEARIYAESIIDTVREPFVVLGKDLKVLSANRSFYSTFKVTPDETVGNLIYDIGDRQWDIPSLQKLLEEILPKNTQFNNYEVSHEFQTIGQKIMLLNARQIYQEVIGTPIILLAIEDITERKQAEKVSQEARIYAENIIETVREPFVVLDKDLKVLSANHSFYSTFEVTPDETVGNLIYDIGNRQWDIPSLRTLLEEILPKNTQFNNYEVSHKFQAIGQKTMLLNARQIYQEVIGTQIILLAIEDITERKLVEKISQEARIYAESIIETVREPLLVLDKDLKVLSANRSFYSTFEVKPDETVGNLIYDIGNRQWDIPSLRTLLEEILPEKTQFNNYEVSHKFQAIGQKTMLLNARQIYQEVIGTQIILLAIEDITERKLVEKISQEARIYAENIIETVREPLLVLDKDLKVLSANRNFYSTFEVTADETVGNLIYDIGNRQWDIPSLRTLLEEILPEKTQFNNYEVSHKFQAIGQKTMLLNARQIYQEVIGTQIILLAIEDITERKLAEKVSHEARIYAESIIDTVREPFVILDKDLKVLSTNRSFYSTFKVTPDETVGNLIYDIGDRQWDIPKLRELLEKIIPMNTQFHDFEIEQEFHNIGLKAMLLNACRLKLESSAMILLAIEDVTERKKLELLHLENERLITAAKARSEFLTIMNHELRTPLTSVIGYSIILEGKTQGGLNEKQMFFVDNILKSSKHLLDLINSFLELAKTEAGKQEMVFEEISVPDAINEIFELIKENAIGHDIILRKKFDPEMLSIRADRMALKQMLFNMLSNAIKFSKKEGGVITVSTKRENDMVKISVADTGIGIKEEDIPRLFQKFEQLDSGISRKYDGTGLGLAITKQLVDMHGGKIWVESKYGEGSNFIFLLPIGGKK